MVPAFAGYSISLNTSIDNVSGGEYSFGLGLFPVGTSFSFNKYFQMVPDYRHQAYFSTSMSFSFRNNWFGGYDFNTGTPQWYLRYIDQGEKGRDFYNGTYFNPYTTLNIYVQQPLGTNPVIGAGNLVTVRVGIETRFEMSLERLGLSRGETGLVFSDLDGNTLTPKSYFNTSNTTYPWLQGDRNSLNNYMYLSTYWYFYRDSGPSVWDGVYMDITAEYGPYWFANTVSPKNYRTSDYFRLSLYLKEAMSIFDSKQSNGYNWVNINVAHENSLAYVGGDTVPANKIPGDRLRGFFSDRISIRFTGPQFIAWDCYPYIEVALNNSLFFGHVVNEPSQETKAVELQSSITMLFHLRLFGFLHLEYTCGYNFIRGIHAAYPGWYQGAQLSFYVSI